MDSALSQLREKVPAWLAELRLEHGSVTVHATPRRLAVLVENLAPGQPDREDLVKGPPADGASGAYASLDNMGFGGVFSQYGADFIKVFCHQRADVAGHEGLLVNR
ncbi:MAG: glycine--tRNA ligase subunit beta, partial [Anaerolineales bacterium]